MRYLKNVTTLKLDTEKCTGCGICRIVCPQGVFEISNGKARLMEKDQCMECGACARNCAFGALKVRAGVGCAAGIIWGAINKTEPICGDGASPSCCGGPPSNKLKAFSGKGVLPAEESSSSSCCKDS